MKQKINMLFFGSPEECKSVAVMMRLAYRLSQYHQFIEHYDDLEKFEYALMNSEPTLLIVLANGAEGMECVYRSKERRPELPIFWFSEDSDFVVQSYRTECAYFSTKPVTQEKLNIAVERCDRMGIKYSITESKPTLKIKEKHIKKSDSRLKENDEETDLRHLGKTQLLELLLEQTRKFEKVQDEFERMSEELDFYKQQTEELHSLAQKILTSHSVMETAQTAAKQYQENIEAMQSQAKEESEKLLQMVSKISIGQRE